MKNKMGLCKTSWLALLFLSGNWNIDSRMKEQCSDTLKELDTIYTMKNEITPYGTVIAGWATSGTIPGFKGTLVFQKMGQKIVRWKSGTIWMSNKQLNKQVKIVNGNRTLNSNLNIIHWNGGSRRWENKLLEIESLLREYKPDLCYISEANLWYDLDPIDRDIQGYRLHLPNTMDSLKHARLVLLAKDDITLEIVTENVNKEAAMIWVKIGASRKDNLLIGGLYRQHQLLGDSRNISKAQQLIEQEARWCKIINKWKNMSRNKNCLVIGDINLDHLKWSTPDGRQEKMVDELKNHIEVNGFLQLITNVTRTWNTQADSILDHIWTNCPDRCIKTLNKTRGSSDHNVIGVEMSARDFKQSGTTIVKRRWKNFKKDECLQEFRNQDWSDILAQDNVDVANSLLEDRICAILDMFAPMVTIQTRTRYKNFITDETKTCMELRDNSREVAKRSGDESDWIEFRRLRNLCTSKQRADKKKQLNEIFENIEVEKDTSKLFTISKNLLGYMKSGTPSCFKVDNVVFRKQKDLANIQVDYYEKKVNTIKDKLPRVNVDPLEILRSSFERWRPAGGRPSFVLKSVTEKEVGEMIAKLKNSHAYGIDRIDAASIKMAAGILIPGITHVINLSLCQAKFPAKWKLARILPLLKSKESDKFNPASYRPVSQLPVLSKLAERSVQRQLLTYLEKNRLISDNHHAYRDNCNTSTALIQLMDSIATAADSNNITATINIDLTAAFDCVPHATLKDKLQFYGLDDLTKNWIDSYLDSRSGFVAIGSAVSRITSLPHGVPQGSVLGPLLYLIFVNEMTGIAEDKHCPNQVHKMTDRLFTRDCDLCGKFPMYADDGQFQYSSNHRGWNQDKVDTVFWRIKNFLNANGLQVNEGKTCLVEFMTHQKRSKISGIPPDLTVSEDCKDRQGSTTVKDKLITDSGTCRMLGLQFRNNLTWDNHLQLGKKALLPALRRQLGLLSKIGQNMSKKARLNLVNCLVLSRLSYAICIWGNTNASQIKKAQVLQNLAGRFVTQMPRITRQVDILNECGWMNVKDLTTYHTLCQMWKTIRWETPRYLHNKITVDDEDKISTTNPRLVITSQSYRWQAVKKWNVLPQDLRTEVSIKKFKIKLKQWIKRRTELDADETGNPGQGQDNLDQTTIPPDNTVT